MRLFVSRLCAFGVIAAVSGCGPDLGAIDPARTTLGAPPAASPSSPFGHGMKAGIDTGPGMLMTRWNPDAATWPSETRNASRRAETSAFTASIGQPVAWQNAAGGISGSVTAIRDYYTDNGDYCRAFSETVVIRGAQRTGQPAACQLPDGSWKAI